MSAFVTGSRAYGAPSDKSDLDLCVFVSPETLKALRELAGPNKATVAKAPEGGSLSKRDLEQDPGDSLYFDGLNLICHTNPHAFAAWKEATAKLCARCPVTRDAVKRQIELAKTTGAA